MCLSVSNTDVAPPACLYGAWLGGGWVLLTKAGAPEVVAAKEEACSSTVGTRYNTRF
jgi:hypothetical protein